jgi:hypothetical protein
VELKGTCVTLKQVTKDLEIDGHENISLNAVDPNEV